MTDTHFTPNTGILSGYDAGKKTVITQLLMTLVAARTALDIRTTNTIEKYAPGYVGEKNEFYFALPKDVEDVLCSYVYFETKEKEKDSETHHLTVNYKPVQIKTETQTTFLNFYTLLLEDNIYQKETDFFFVIYYRRRYSPILLSEIKNGYLFYFKRVLNVEEIQKFERISEYIRYLTSGNLNMGNTFTVFKVTDGVLKVHDTINNKSLDIPVLSNTDNENVLISNNNISEIDYLLPALVKKGLKNSKKIRLSSTKEKNAESGGTYIVSKSSDLSECCSKLFEYITVINKSKIINFPTTPTELNNDINDDIIIYNNHRVPLLIISYFITRNNREIIRVFIHEPNISRLIFGTGNEWISVVESNDSLKETAVKTPGNGALLQILCNKASDENGVISICGELAHITDGIMNEFLGKSTSFLENTMIYDANIVRSLNGTTKTYTKITGVDITDAFVQNFGQLIKHFASMRNDNDNVYQNYIQILQDPKSYIGLRSGQKKSDSTKFVSTAEKDIMFTISHKSTLNQIIDKIPIKRIDGGEYMVAVGNKIKNLSENRSLFSPFDYVAKSIRNIFTLYGTHLDFIIPKRIIGGIGGVYDFQIPTDTEPFVVEKSTRNRPIVTKPNNFSEKIKKNPNNVIVNNQLYIKNVLFFIDMYNMKETSTTTLTLSISLARKLRLLKKSEKYFRNIYEIIPNTVGISNPIEPVYISSLKKDHPTLHHNFITNCDKVLLEERYSFFEGDNLIEIMDICRKVFKDLGDGKLHDEDLFVKYILNSADFIPIDFINGFLLCGKYKVEENGPWLMNPLYYTAFNASIIYDRQDFTSNDIDMVIDENPTTKIERPSKRLFVNIANIPIHGVINDNLYISLNETAMSHISVALSLYLKCLRSKTLQSYAFDWINGYPKIINIGVSSADRLYMYQRNNQTRASGLVVKGGLSPTNDTSTFQYTSFFNNTRAKNRNFFTKLNELNKHGNDMSKSLKTKLILEASKYDWMSIYGSTLFGNIKNENDMFFRRIIEIQLDIRKIPIIDRMEYNTKEYIAEDISRFFEESEI